MQEVIEGVGEDKDDVGCFKVPVTYQVIRVIRVIRVVWDIRVIRVIRVPVA